MALKRSGGLRSKGMGAQSGFKSKPGKPPPRSEEDGIRVVAGKVRVRSRAYMKDLHENPRTLPPLDLRAETGEAPQGPVELHHASTNADRTTARLNDAAVVKLRQSDHYWVEMNGAEERNLNRLFGVWSAFSFWCFSRGEDPSDPMTGQRFLKEVILLCSHTPLSS